MKDKVFLSSIVTLLVGVPLMIYTIEFFSDDITSLLLIIVLSGLIIAVLFLIILKFREEILNYIFKSSKISVDETIEPLIISISKIASKEKEDQKIALESFKDFIRSLGSRYAWISFRRFLVSILVGTLLAFIGLISAHLLIKQNEILLSQNDFLKQQVVSQAINTAFDDIYSNLPEGKREQAVHDYLRLLKEQSSERRIANLRNADLENFKIRDWIFNSVDFSKANLSHCDAVGAKFVNADFSNAKFSNGGFSNTYEDTLWFLSAFFDEMDRKLSLEKRFMGAEFHDCTFDFTNMSYVNFSGASFINCTWKNFNSSNLYGAIFSRCEGIPAEVLATISENYGFGSRQDVNHMILYIETNRDSLLNRFMKGIYETPEEATYRYEELMTHMKNIKEEFQ